MFFPKRCPGYFHIPINAELPVTGLACTLVILYTANIYLLTIRVQRMNKHDVRAEAA